LRRLRETPTPMNSSAGFSGRLGWSTHICMDVKSLRHALTSRGDIRD